MTIATSLKTLAKTVLPKRLLGQMRLLRARQKYSGVSREQIFSDIYDKGVWGKSDETLYSGPGSITENIIPYSDFVSNFIATHKIGSVVDFGCGDFQVGRRFVLGSASYLGCDIVPRVVDENSRRFSNKNISFRTFDLLGDVEYPQGELCLIRQVLQHFSNRDVTNVLSKLKHYSYVLITDAQTVGDKSTTNFDIETFHLSRSIYDSGLRLELPPFSLPIDVVLEYPHISNEHDTHRPLTNLRTVSVRMPKEKHLDNLS